MSYLSRRFSELENNLYLHMGHILTADLCPAIALVLDSAAAVLGYSVDMMTGDDLALRLKMQGETDLVKELRTAINIYNATLGD